MMAKAHITADSRRKHQATEEFRIKNRQIVKRVNAEFAVKIRTEKNLIKKMRLRVKKRRKIKAELDLLMSRDILFGQSNALD